MCTFVCLPQANCAALLTNSHCLLVFRQRSGLTNVYATGNEHFMYAGFVLHCMPQADCEALFRNSHSMLKPGGVLYGTTAGRLEGASEWDYTKDASRTGMLYSPVSSAPVSTLMVHQCTLPVHKRRLHDQYAVVASKLITSSMCFSCISEVLTLSV